MQGRKTVGAGTCPAAAVADAVRTCAVPRHTNEKWPIVAEVGRPPFLRVRHHGMKVLDHGIQVEALEFFRVIELLAHWICERRAIPRTGRSLTFLRGLTPPLQRRVASPSLHPPSNQPEKTAEKYYAH